MDCDQTTRQCVQLSACVCVSLNLCVPHECRCVASSMLSIASSFHDLHEGTRTVAGHHVLGHAFNPAGIPTRALSAQQTRRKAAVWSDTNTMASWTGPRLPVWDMTVGCIAGGTRMLTGRRPDVAWWRGDGG